MQIDVATRKGLFHVRKSGADWTISDVSFLADNVSLTMTDLRSGNAFAALDHGHFGVKLHRRKPGGEWEELAAPAFPPKPEGLVDLDGWGRELPWTVMRVWALEPGGADQPGLIWCGTIPGGLFRSDDNGDSWSLVKGLWHHPSRNKWMGGGADWPGIHSICVDPRDSKVVRVAVSCGGVWTTRDSGETWTCTANGMRAEFMPPDQNDQGETQDPHFMTQSRTSPDRLWVQHHNGIFISSDGSASWREIHEAGPSTFGFPVAVHPNDGDTAWFVPGIKDEKRIPVEGALAVTRTRDGGRTFETLRHGLPQVHAYDVVLRHALDVDSTGNFLAFGSTTGGLWVSEDQGDHWTMVSHTLPPVYGVRFAA